MTFVFIGLGVATFHAGRSAGLASHLRVQRVPALLGVVNGRATYYRGHVVSQQHLRDFIRGFFPTKTLQIVNIQNINTF